MVNCNVICLWILVAAHRNRQGSRSCTNRYQTFIAQLCKIREHRIRAGQCNHCSYRSKTTAWTILVSWCASEFGKFYSHDFNGFRDAHHPSSCQWPPMLSGTDRSAWTIESNNSLSRFLLCKLHTKGRAPPAIGWWRVPSPCSFLPALFDSFWSQGTWSTLYKGFKMLPSPILLCLKNLCCILTKSFPWVVHTWPYLKNNPFVCLSHFQKSVPL